MKVTGAEIDGKELVSRFILQSSHIRKDLTVRQDAFIPHPWPDLSVTRHIGLSDARIWEIARAVARAIPKNLYGRASLHASVFQGHKLTVVSAPDSENPNHANVSGWPDDKPAQKIIALQLAAEARYTDAPKE